MCTARFSSSGRSAQSPNNRKTARMLPQIFGDPHLTNKLTINKSAIMK